MPVQSNTKIVTQTHRIFFSDLCPVSTNPKAGSFIEITYTPQDYFLEVYSLQKFVDSFSGGKRLRDTFIRDMEQTIQAISQECVYCVQVPCQVKAHLILDCGEMDLEVFADVK